MLAFVPRHMRSLAKYTSFDSYAYTDIRRMRFAPNCNNSPGLARPVESSYEDYSVMKDTHKTHRSYLDDWSCFHKHSGKASRDQVLLQATVWEARRCLSLFRRCVKPYVYAEYVYSSATLWIGTPMAAFPPCGELITAREFNAHVQPVHTKYRNLGVHVQYCAYYSDDEIRITCSVRCPSRTKWSILWPLGCRRNFTTSAFE